MEEKEQELMKPSEEVEEPNEEKKEISPKKRTMKAPHAKTQQVKDSSSPTL